MPAHASRCARLPEPVAPAWTQHVLTIARFTLLEAVRTRFPWIAAGTLLAIALSGCALEQIALTDSARVRVVFLAAACRVATVVLMCQYVVACVVRELDDQAVRFVLALSVPRSALYAGKLLGFCGVALAAVALTGLLLAPQVDAQRLLPWCVLLFAELGLMTGVALFCAFGTRQAVTASLACAAVYVVSRSLAGLERLGADPVELGDNVIGHGVHLAIRALSMLLPDLSRFARSQWLADAAAAPLDLAGAAMQSALYLLLTAAAGIHDLERRDF